MTDYNVGDIVNYWFDEYVIVGIRFGKAMLKPLSAKQNVSLAFETDVDDIERRVCRAKLEPEIYANKQTCERFQILNSTMWAIVLQNSMNRYDIRCVPMDEFEEKYEERWL